MRTVRIAAALLFALALFAASAEATSIVIINKDPAGVGFNDTTAAAPVGGNSGTTLGQQRLNVFNAAAAIWAAKLSSPVTIKISASFGPLTPCTPGGGVLGHAGPTDYLINFTGAPRANTWYPVAIASALSGVDQAAGLTDGASISAEFNSDVGTAGCLPYNGWYLGLDGNHGALIDLETVLLHEFAHGLGFVGVVNFTDGSFGGTTYPDIYSTITYDNTVHMYWNTMSAAQRVTSSTNSGNVVFDGTNVNAGASILIAGKDGSGHAKLYIPSTIEQGSSVYHFDTSASPNQLMEPSINGDLTHNVDLPNDLTTKAMLDMGWPPAASAPSAPTGVIATATSVTSIRVAWITVSGATSYEIWRKSAGGSFTKVNSSTVTATPYTDTVSSTTAAYLYRVVAVNSGGSSAPSAPDLAVNAVYTDASLQAQTTPIRAAHITELRTAIGAVRTLAGLGSATWTYSVAANALIHAADVTDLRTNLDAAITAINTANSIALTTGGWTDSTLNSSVNVRATHISEIRNRM